MRKKTRNKAAKPVVAVAPVVARKPERRHLLVIVIALLTTIAGAVSLYSIPIAQYPDIVPPHNKDGIYRKEGGGRE